METDTLSMLEIVLGFFAFAILAVIVLVFISLLQKVRPDWFREEPPQDDWG